MVQIKHGGEATAQWQELVNGASEYRYRTTLDAMGDAIYVVDAELRITLANKRMQDWSVELGLTTDLVGRTIRDAFPFLPEQVRRR